MAFDNDNETAQASRAAGISAGSRVFGMFADRDEAIEAIRALKSAGFGESAIGVAMKDRGDQQVLMEETGSDAAHGAAAGAVSGGLVGGLIGLLGSLLIPGVGPIVVGGVLASTLTGAGIGAASGGLIGALIGAGASEEEATHFDTGFRAGGVLVTVDAGDRRQEASTMLQAHGADLGPAAGIARAARAFSERPRSDAEDFAVEDEAGRADRVDLTRGGGFSGAVGTGSGDQGLGTGAGFSSGAGLGTGAGRGAGASRIAGDIGGLSGTGRDWGSGYDGEERRNRHDPAYSGPERRLAGV